MTSATPWVAAPVPLPHLRLWPPGGRDLPDIPHDRCCPLRNSLASRFSALHSLLLPLSPSSAHGRLASSTGFEGLRMGTRAEKFVQSCGKASWRQPRWRAWAKEDAPLPHDTLRCHLSEIPPTPRPPLSTQVFPVPERKSLSTSALWHHLVLAFKQLLGCA